MSFCAFRWANTSGRCRAGACHETCPGPDPRSGRGAARSHRGLAVETPDFPRWLIADSSAVLSSPKGRPRQQVLRGGSRAETAGSFLTEPLRRPPGRGVRQVFPLPGPAVAAPAQQAVAVLGDPDEVLG